MELLNSFSGFELECGTDEAGRGCLAGPVTAAAVILPMRFKDKILNDSKALSHKSRLQLKSIIIKEAIAFSFHHNWMDVIDDLNILNASIDCMHKSIDLLNPRPNYIIVDGNRFKDYKEIPHTTVIKGDCKYLSIAAASIVAKTERDSLMERLHEEFPVYNWKKNKGYPTREHREAIMTHGITKYHRKSFKLLPDQLQLAL